MNSAAAAYWIKEHAGKDVIFTLATRDMNRVAIQSMLLGAQLLGLENVIVVKGDDFTRKELSLLRGVGDFRPTSLLRSIGDMNEGIDFKGLRLQAPTSFCAGASIDLGRDIGDEVGLTRRKVAAGARFFISQPTFHPDRPREFLDRYARTYGEELSVPVFHGIQVMTPGGVVFSDVPGWVMRDLRDGRPGEDIALQVYRDFTRAGFRSFYIVPPILRGGGRDYEAAQAAIAGFRDH